MFPANKRLLLPEVMEGLYRIDVTENRMIEVETSFSGVIYFFDFELELRGIRLTHRFRRMYNERLLEGRFAEPFDHDAIADKMLPQIRYWSGGDWVPSPTMTKYWRERQH
jgi:hypothetical protein